MTSNFYANEKLGLQEAKISSTEAFSRLLPFLVKHKLNLAICLIILAIATVLSLAWPILLQHAIDDNITNGDYKGLLYVVALIGAIQGTTILLQYIQTVKLEIIGQNIMVDLKKKLFDHILSLNVSFFDNNPVGRLMARIESDTESLRMMFTRTVVMVVGDMLLVAGIFGVMFYYSWRLTLILLLTVPFVSILVYVFQKLTAERYYDVRRKMAEITSSLAEFVQGMSIIQIFHRGKYVKGRLYETNKAKFVNDSYLGIAVSVFFNSVHLFQNLMVAAVLLFGLLWIKSGALTVGTISMFIVLIWRAFEPIRRASEQLSNIQRAVAGARRIFSMLENNDKLVASAAPIAWNGLLDAIRFEDVWFSYNGDENWVLKNINFEVHKGQQIALAGITGGGKTTLIMLLLRFYDPQRGRITVDGIDIRNIAIADLRKQFALVLQDIYLFPGDIKSNIALDCEEIPDEKIISASSTVDADGFIMRLPEQYRTVVSEKGANFSRGERQLLSFARALAADPDILILDEATSSVDPHTEETIQNSLKKLMAGRTSLVIAHRLMTILEADQILVIRQGEIIERGNHTDLILQNGYYSKLFHLQFKNGVNTNVG